MMLKRILFGVVCLLMITSTALGVSALPFNGGDGRLSQYDYDLYMYPTWGGGVVYQENTVFYVDGNGDVVGGKLLYAPDKILSVRTFGLKDEFKEGIDYVVTETGIQMTENSSIPVMPREAYCKEEDKDYTHQLDDGNGGAIYTDNSVLPKYFLSVSYTTSATWEGALPKNELDHLAKVKSKLENKEPVTIAILGDSISVGYTTSGLNDPSYRVNGQQITVKVNIDPYMPTWPKLLCEALKRAYGYDDITVVNWAIGGTNTMSDCLGDMLDRVVSSQPDLVTIGFGMNEFWCPANQHGDRTESIMDQLRSSLPEVEFVLLSSMLPNMMAYDANNMKLADFEVEYYDIQKNRTDLGIAVAPVNTIYTYVQGIKGDFAVLGGNQNHPNDFSVRLYAQTVATVLGAYDTPVVVNQTVADGEVGTAYTARLEAYCVNDVAWKVTDGNLPAGLTLSADGTVSGTPTEGGEFTFTAVAESGSRQTAVTLTMTVNGETPTTESTPIDTAKPAGPSVGLVAAIAGLAVALVAVGAVIVVKKALKS